MVLTLVALKVPGEPAVALTLRTATRFCISAPHGPVSLLNSHAKLDAKESPLATSFRENCGLSLRP